MKAIITKDGKTADIDIERTATTADGKSTSYYASTGQEIETIETKVHIFFQGKMTVADKFEVIN